MSSQAANPRARSVKGSVVSTTYEFPYLRQKSKKTLGQLIYDSQQGKVLGRTPKNWGQLFLFYTIFYIALAALFLICMKALLYTINDDHPKWVLSESIIGTNPGLSFRPNTEEVDQGTIPLITFNSQDTESIDFWVKNLDEFLKDYEPHRYKNCDFQRASNGTCAISLSEYASCTKSNKYGFAESKPCIFLKLNRIYDWMPEFYNDSNNLPDDMPVELKSYIKNLPKDELNQIWVSCSTKVDKGNEVKQIEYFPSRGFPSYFYPYRKTKGYLSPLVAVQFTHVEPNQTMTAECRAWAKNIIYNGSNRERQGSTQFEIKSLLNNP